MSTTAIKTTARRPSPTLRVDLNQPALFLTLVALTGLAGGAITFWAQGVLPDWLSLWANSGALWALFALATGTVASRRTLAIAGGVLSQWGLVFGYYELSDTHTVWWNRFDPVWIAAGIISGVVFGLIGYLCRSPHRWVQHLAITLLPALAIGTSLEYGLRTEAHYAGLNPIDAAIMCVIALAAVVCSTRRPHDRLLRAAITVVLGVNMYLLQVAVILPTLDLGFATT